MAEISAKLVMELRERTGAGMMECKKALVAANGNIEQAIDDMRKQGQAKADKKASRVAAEGVVVIQHGDDQRQAALVEINCETDFVARDSNFTHFATHTAQHLLTGGSLDDAALDEQRRELITKLGENISLRRAEVLSTAGHLGAYVHGGRIGVLVEMIGGDADLAKDIAMHIAASAPLVVSGEAIPADTLAKEKEIYLAQAQESGKAPEVIAKMVEGRLRKFLEEVSLLGQPFVKDPAIRVADLLKTKQAEVKRFVRYVVGEGIVKEQTDFVKEVMAQAKGN